MHLPKFKHLRPKTIEEVIRHLDTYGKRARLVSGGTDLFPRMKYGLVRPDVVINLKGIPMREPALNEEGELYLGALIPLADVARSQLVLEKAPLLAKAALSVGSNEIRHMGTLGGNLCLENRCSYFNQSHAYQFVDPCLKRDGDLCYHIPGGKKCWAVFCADTVPALISLGALVQIKGPEGAREFPLERFYTGDALHPFDLSPQEVLTGILIPVTPSPRGSALKKFSLRGGMEFAALNVAVVLEVEEDGVTCHTARITVGSLFAGPIRMTKAEESLIGQHLSGERIRDAAGIISSEIRPYPHHGYSAAYLRECLRVQTKRALVAASESIQ